MADIAACLTSRNEHYCSPPTVTVPMRHLLAPNGRGRTIIDPATNSASIVQAEFICAGDDVDGLQCDWSEADGFYVNPPYGGKIAAWAEAMARWGAAIPGVALLPARTDTRWMQDHIFRTAAAWVLVRGRLTFWTPIPLAKASAAPVGEGEPYYLRRWYPWAEDNNLPEPFRLLTPGFAVGPELGSSGHPQSAPFPSLIVFWGHPGVDKTVVRTSALKELVRCASRRFYGEIAVKPWMEAASRVVGEPALVGTTAVGAAAYMQTPERTYPDVRDFARHFLRRGTLTIPRGPHAGVYRG